MNSITHIKCTNRYGDTYWTLNGLLDRADGPSIEFANGDKCWYLNNDRHREDGPAIEYANGDKVWYLNGVKLDCTTQEEFLKLMKLKSFW